MHNIIEIRPFRNNVASCDRWPINEGGQLHKFYCILCDGKRFHFRRHSSARLGERWVGYVL